MKWKLNADESRGNAMTIRHEKHWKPVKENMMKPDYNGGLTREQFLFFEIRIVATFLLQGLNREEVLKKIKDENLFQFPTERMISSIANTCFKRIDALESESLVYHLANSSAEAAKQINLYAMMKYNRIVWDFMTTVIAEKYRTQEFEFGKRIFIFFLQVTGTE